MRNLGVTMLLLAVVLTVTSCTVKTSPTTGAGTPQPTTPAASGPAPEPKAAGPQVASLDIGEQYADDAIGNATTTFAPTAPVMHVAASITGLAKGATIRGTLRAVDVTDAKGNTIRDYEVASKELSAPGAESTAHFEFSAPTAGWPVGKYVVEVAVDGQIIKTAEITVEKAAG